CLAGGVRWLAWTGPWVDEPDRLTSRLRGMAGHAAAHVVLGSSTEPRTSARCRFTNKMKGTHGKQPRLAGAYAQADDDLRRCPVIGYYFQSRVEDCTRRNEQRPAEERIPVRGILGTSARMELPSRKEGFDELFYVRIDEANRFVVEEWQDEV